MKKETEVKCADVIGAEITIVALAKQLLNPDIPTTKALKDEYERARDRHLEAVRAMEEQDWPQMPEARERLKNDPTFGRK